MQLGIAFAGAAIGSSFGTMGAQIGWMIGTAAGALLMGNKGTNKEQLQDLKVSTSTYGKGVNIVYGTMRVQSNMIWATDLVKRKNGKKDGKGKGGGGKKGGTSYSYYANWASALCEGPVDRVTRVWADGKLIYSEFADEAHIIYRSNKKKKKKVFGITPKSGSSASSFLRPFTVHYGTEDQMPDPTIEMHEGAGNTPAYRGLCYLVFSNFALEEWGNRIPSITAEVMVNKSKATVIPPDQKYVVKLPDSGPLPGGSGSVYREGGLHFDHRRGYAYAFDTDPIVSGRRILRVFDTAAGEIRRVMETEILGGESAVIPVDPTGAIGGTYTITAINTIVGVLPTGDLLMRAGNRLLVVSTASYLIQSVYEPGYHGLQMPCLRMLDLSPVTSMTGDSRFMLVSENGTANNVQVCSVDYDGIKHLGSTTIDFAPGQPNFAPQSLAAGGSVGDSLSIDVFGLAQHVPGWANAEGSRYSTLSRFRVTFRFDKDEFENNRWFADFGGLVVLKGDVETHFPGTGASDPSLLVVNAGATVVTLPTEFYGNGPTPWIYAINADTGAVEWQTTYPNGISSVLGFHNLASAGPIASGYFGFMSGTIVEVDVRNRTIYQSSPVYDADNPPISGGQFWSEGHFRAYGNSGGSFGWLQFGEVRDSVKGRIGDILRDVCERVGLDVTQINTASLDEIDVPGVLIDNPVEARSFVEMLSQAFLFDACESDDVIRFVSRGKAPILTIPKADLSPIDDTGATFKETTVQALELPQFVSITHADPSQDYNTGTQHAKRSLNPLPTMHSRGTVDITLPMAMSTDQAKRLAEMKLYSAWQEAKTRELKTTLKYAWLDPTDVVVLDIGGFTYQDRIVKADFGSDLTVAFSSTQQEPGTYSSTATGSITDGSPVSEYPPLPYLRPFPVDAPMLHDSDNPGQGNLRIRVLALPNKAGFTGTLGEVSIDGIAGTDQQYVGDPTPWGAVVGTVEPPPYGPFVVDDVTEIRLRPSYLEESDWASIGENEWRQGANAVYCGGELIFYRDATIEEDGSVTLSHLLRGRRGTDFACSPGFHVRNETIVKIVPDLDASVEVTVPVQNIGSTAKVTLSFPVDSGGAQNSTRFDITSMSVRPLPPAALTRVEDGGGLAFGWQYQARFGGEGLRDGTGAVPFTEPNIRYEFYVLDQPYRPAAEKLRRPEFYLRKYESEAAAAAYLPSHMFADGKALTDDIHVVVFQVSDLGGLGLPLFQTTRA